MGSFEVFEARQLLSFCKKEFRKLKVSVAQFPNTIQEGKFPLQSTVGIAIRPHHVIGCQS